MIAFLLALSVSGDPSGPPEPHVIEHPDWIAGPSAQGLERYYPARALNNGITGQAFVRCAVNADGTLDGCVAQLESPAGLGFGPASVRAASKFRMRPLSIDGQSVSGAYVLIPFNWAFDGAPPPQNVVFGLTQRPAELTTARALDDYSSWLRGRAIEALANRGAGVCAQTLAVARAEAPVVEREQLPAEIGPTPGKVFREHLQVAGCGSAAEVDLLVWRDAQGHLASYRLHQSQRKIAELRAAAEGEQIETPMWAAAPNQAARDSVYPSGARARGLGGSALLDCGVNGAGALQDCRVKAESPVGEGFGDAALSLAPLYRMKAVSRDGVVVVNGARVDVPMVWLKP
jgi:TonB family protein